MPSRPSSPTKPTSLTIVGGISSDATSTPMAIATSSDAPILRSADGARLTVMRLLGHPMPELMNAARTRSRASRHAVSGRPTSVKLGMPTATWTSTTTGWPSTPSSVADRMLASTGTPHE